MAALPDTELLFGGIAAVGWGLWAFTTMVLYAVIGAIADVVCWAVAAETWRDVSKPVRWITGLLIGAVVALRPAPANAAPPEPADQTVTDDELAAPPPPTPKPRLRKPRPKASRPAPRRPVKAA